VLFRFRLLDPDGNDLGPFVSAESDWQPGRWLNRGTSGSLVVTAVIQAEGSAGYSAYLVVAPAPPAVA
jgi:hypothetical protein